VLIAGSAGQVGHALLQSVPSGIEVEGLTHAQLDISDAVAVRRAVAERQPSVIINVAAYTAVDQAESDPKTAAAFNAEGPRNLAEAASAVPGCRLVQISTDYVFDGQSSQPYRPDDVTNPINVYGRTKLDGERAVLQVLGQRSVVLRTSWVYAPRGRNFVLTMLRAMRERNSVRVVGDQRGSPTAAASVARALWRILELPDVHGILHWTDAGVVSWYDFACAIAEDGVTVGVLSQRAAVTAITTAEYPTLARRPPYSALDIEETRISLGLEPVPWRTQLRTTLVSCPSYKPL